MFRHRFWCKETIALGAVLATLLLPIREAVAHTIEVSASQYGYECQLGNDQGPGLRSVYVIHAFNAGAFASRFRVSLGSGATMSYVSETHAFATTLGDTQSGMTVCYGACVENTLVATMTYMSYASDDNCSKVLVLPHPSAETVEIIDCYGVPRVATVRDLNILAPGGICGCPTAHGFPGTAQYFDCVPLPVENKTWGAVKALFRN